MSVTLVVAAGGAAVTAAVGAVARSCREQHQYVTDLDRGAVPSTLRGRGQAELNDRVDAFSRFRDAGRFAQCDPGIPPVHREGAPLVEGTVLRVQDHRGGS